MAGDDTWTAAEPLGQRAAVTPDRTALIDLTDNHNNQYDAGSSDSECWTYRALDAATDAVAARLRQHLPTDPPTRRVGIAVSPRVEFVTALYATLRLGWTVVPFDPGRPGAALADRVDRTDPALVVCDRESEPRCLGTSRPVVSVDEPQDSRVSPLLATALEDDEAAHPGPSGGTAADRSEALLLFTSGTTGRPKVVRLTLSNLCASAVASAFRLGVTPTDRWLGCLPLHHMGGLAPVFRSAWYGTTLVLQGSFETERTEALIESQGITGVSLVPTQLKRLLDAGWSPPDRLRTVLLGGAPADASLLSRALDADVPVCPTYGLTETASQVATALPSTVREHPNSVGQPLLWTDVTILDDDTQVDSGERGEVIVDGPTVAPGYLDDQATEAAFGEHGLHTGDLGVRDADGRLRILGRIDDVINTGGELVVPAEVVSVLESHPGILEAAVVGLDDPEWGERVAALIVPTVTGSRSDTTGLDVDTLLDHCREQLAAYKLPKTVVTADRIPRTDSGTVDRDAVAAEIERRE